MLLFYRRTVLLPLVLVFVLVCCSFGVDSRAVKGRHKNVGCGLPVKTIVVDQHGRGNYYKIQDAVNSIRPGNTQWIAIQLNPGKSCILLQGYDRYTTSIEWNQGTLGNPFDTATFTSSAENFVARNITFKNTHNLEVQGIQVAKAVAAAILGDKSSFYDCSFIGVQDTLADASGRHYFHNCHIEGAMDFIWGNGQSIYEYCEILVQPYPDPLRRRVISVITAQTRESEKQTTGFVFKSGKLNGVHNPLTVLGRALGSYSTVLFMNMRFSSSNGRVVNIVPTGWDSLGKNVRRILYAEAGNTGIGSGLHDRVKWEKNLTPNQWKYYTDMSFIDRDGWLSRQHVAIAF
ncbi:hypothetical protein MKX01_032661 [Papaver californicum]|nr:hypothetical protein MKX01_032661 [Papaver californicum]